MWWRSRHITSSTPTLESYADDSLLDSDGWMGWGRDIRLLKTVMIYRRRDVIWAASPS